MSTDNVYAYAWIGNTHSNYIEMREMTILVIQCHNDLQKREYRTCRKVEFFRGCRNLFSLFLKLDF